ncbi:hypothetical protein L3Q82_000001, partial [Scortum barcoo]
NTIKRVTLPGTGVGFNNKFPYCYYDCRANSDVDLEADETGLWAIYATVGNHDEYHEEVFYAFDTATGKEDNSLTLPMEKISKGVASLSYNPTNKQIYMYNDGYLLAYQANF